MIEDLVEPIWRKHLRVVQTRNWQQQNPEKCRTKTRAWYKQHQKGIVLQEPIGKNRIRRSVVQKIVLGDNETRRK